MWEALGSIQSPLNARSKLMKQLTFVAVVALVMLMAFPFRVEAQDEPSDDFNFNFDLVSLMFTEEDGTRIDIGLFDPDTTEYSASVDSTVERITVDFTTTYEDHPNSSYFVFLSPWDASSSDDGHQVDLNFGKNLVMVTVDTGYLEAEDALKKYSVEITRGGAGAGGHSQLCSHPRRIYRSICGIGA